MDLWDEEDGAFNALAAYGSCKFQIVLFDEEGQEVQAMEQVMQKPKHDLYLGPFCSKRGLGKEDQVCFSNNNSDNFISTESVIDVKAHSYMLKFRPQLQQDIKNCTSLISWR